MRAILVAFCIGTLLALASTANAAEVIPKCSDYLATVLCPN